MTEDDDEREALKGVSRLGLEKTAKKYVFNSEVAEEDRETRMMTILGGVLHITQAHLGALYDRVLLRSEASRHARLFKQTHKSEDPPAELATIIDAVCDGYMESLLYMEASSRAALVEKPEERQANLTALFHIRAVADCMLRPVLLMMSSEELQKLKKEEAPLVLSAAVAGLKNAYVGADTEEAETAITFHAKAQLQKTLASILKHRQES